MRLIAKIAIWIARFFIYGVIWGILYNNAGYMKSVQDIK